MVFTGPTALHEGDGLNLRDGNFFNAWALISTIPLPST
jgi:hypothetical protein